MTLVGRLEGMTVSMQGGSGMEATLERRLVMQGDPDTPYLKGAFFVAAYQRGYRWGRDEVRQLLDDIKGNLTDAQKRREFPGDYILQPIVVLRRDDGWELVDGQQRLTTLLLITKYIATTLPGSAVAYSLSYETREGSKQYLENLDRSRRDENIDFHHIAAAYDAIAEWFSEQSNATQAAIDIHSALSQWVYVIWYEAPPGTDPTELFIRLNRDRIPLTDSELIKALVLSNSAREGAQFSRQQEIAAQWDGFERDLRDAQFWAFLTGSSTTRSTHIDFLFESLTPDAGLKARPRFWTFSQVLEQVAATNIDAFWDEVVARHGLLVGWYKDRELYHRIGYLIATGTHVTDLIEASKSQTHSAFATYLRQLIRNRLDLTAADVSLLRYDDSRHAEKCVEILLLMNVETVLASSDQGARFSFFEYALRGWSLEHIHAQNSQEFKKEEQRRDWLVSHRAKINKTTWNADAQGEVDALIRGIDKHLALPPTRTDIDGFQDIQGRVFTLFSTDGDTSDEDDLHGLGNLALLQREFNSKLNNAVFALKRERILELDAQGAYLLPCTRNVFLKYYTGSEDQQLSFWSSQDRAAYYDTLIAVVSDFLKPDVITSGESD